MKWLGAAWWTVGLAAAASAEGGRSVEGLVVDDSGAVVVDARVTVRRPAVGFETTVRSGPDGHFRAELPRPGEYEVTAEKDGFSLARRRVSVTEADAGGGVRLRLRPGVFSEEIEVIATRLTGGPETLRRIPGSIEVLLPEALGGARVLNVTEALRKVSGVHVRDEEGMSLRPNIGIRGLSPTRSSKLLLLEDGLPLAFAPYGDNATYYHPPIERFESVEILKGSGQISYGPVTVGGVVNYLTAGPPAKPQAQLRLAGGDRGYTYGHARAGGTWGAAGLIADYLRKEGDGSRDNVHSTLHDANLKAVVGLGGRQTLTLKGNVYAEDSQVTYSGLRRDEYLAGPRANPFANDAFTGRRYGASAKHSLLLGGDALLTTQLYASRFSRDWWRQSSNSGQRPNDAADPKCGGMANLLTTCGNEGRLRDYDHLGLEPRLRLGHHLLGASSELELGVRAHLEVQERRQQNGETPTARSGLTVEDNHRENRAYSAFVQNRVLLGRWTLTPGVRLERIDYQRINRLANGGQGAAGRTDLTQWVPGLGVAWAPGGRVSVFAGVHRGFAPPRTEDIINNTTGGAIDLEPERSWNYELGARAQLRPGLGADLTLFRMDYQNQIVPASLAGGVGATLTNGGETLHQGLELAGRLDTGTLTASSHNLSLRLAVTFLPTARFEGVRFSNISGFSRVSVSGNRLPYAPERTLTASVGYTHPTGLSGLIELVHVGEQFTDDLNSVEVSADGQRGRIPAGTIWNATFNHELRARHLTAFLAVKNLLDRLYVVDRSRGTLPGPPRTIQAGLEVRF
jgi:Fe(3+) dicitrate transport protein